jgi:hypothetical protein
MRTLLLAGLLSVATLSSADIGGTWVGEIPFTFNGQHLRLSQQVAIKLVQRGEKLEGKLYGDYDSSPIIEGKISGDQIDFVVIAQEQQGNQINETRHHFTGTLQKDGDLELTRVRESATTAGNGGAYKYKAEQAKQTFRVKRLS